MTIKHNLAFLQLANSIKDERKIEACYILTFILSPMFHIHLKNLGI